MKKQPLLCALAVLLGALLALAAMWWSTSSPARAASTIRYVATDGTDSGNCDTIAGRCRTIQYAISRAVPGDEIRVAGGVYTGTAGTVAAITKSLVIIGGFGPGFTEPAPEFHETVLDARWAGSVISITNVGDPVSLQFLTLTRGDGTGNCWGTTGCGGGIYAQNTILNVGCCVITNNVASRGGGGMGGGLCARDSSVEIWDSVIVSNTASADLSSTPTAYGGGVFIESSTGARSASLRQHQILDNVGHVAHQGRGGGVYLYGLESAEVTTNTIRGNRATTYNATSGWGGGLDIENCSHVYVAGNRIEDNVTHPNPSYGGYGGGVYVGGSDAHLARNIISGNANSEGGGVFIRSAQPVTLSNNLIARNDNDGVYVVEYYAPGVSRALLVNNTIVDNGYSGVVAQTYAVVTLTNNLIAGQEIGLDASTPLSSVIAANVNLFLQGLRTTA